MSWLLCLALLATPRPSIRHQQPAPSASAAQPLSQDEVRERVDAYLGSIDVPVTPDHWRALGPQAAGLLESIVNDSNAFPSRRSKALYGLIAAAPERAAKIVGPMARDEREPVVVRVAAIQGVSELMPSKALAELKPVMQSAKTAGLRGVAADAIARRKDACGAVKAQAAREKGADREAYNRALARCE